MNFFDQQKTSDGRPYAPIKYKQLVEQCYIICKQCNMSYNDVLKMSVREKDYMLEFMKREADYREKLFKNE